MNVDHECSLLPGGGIVIPGVRRAASPGRRERIVAGQSSRTKA
ncbi:hypothetical protein [Leclercia sp. LSNIH3]